MNLWPCGCMSNMKFWARPIVAMYPKYPVEAKKLRTPVLKMTFTLPSAWWPRERLLEFENKESCLSASDMVKEGDDVETRFLQISVLVKWSSSDTTRKSIFAITRPRTSSITTKHRPTSRRSCKLHPLRGRFPSNYILLAPPPQRTDLRHFDPQTRRPIVRPQILDCQSD